MVVEERRFKMHERLLYDVIRRQAGTLGKAILEGVMNSVDAKSSRCDIALTNTTLSIVDDGAGFKSRKEVVDWFEVFGQPLSEGEEKRYGTFRMGRGQLFAFGLNTWRTGNFVMNVDIKGHGLDYHLEEVDNLVKGCLIKITLYDELTLMQKADIEREVTQLVKYVPIEVTLNGKRISVDPETEKWDHVLPEGYIRLQPNRAVLSVYNLGVHVRDYVAYQFGTGGVIVSTKPLKVNFARNDIMQSECQVWKALRKFINTKATGKNKRKRNLNEPQRKRLSDQLRFNELEPRDAQELKLLTDVKGRHWSIRQIAERIGYRFFHRYTSAPDGDILGEHIHTQGLAFVFAQQTLDRFEAKDAKHLMEMVKKWWRPVYGEEYWKWRYTDFEELTKGMDTTHVILDKEELRPIERVQQRLIENCAFNLFFDNGGTASRKIFVGKSASSDAWTDGNSYIAIDREFLSKQGLHMKGLINIGLTLLHEYCHETPSLKTHDHTPEFYQMFHDNTHAAAEFSDNAFRRVGTVCEQEGRKIARHILAAKDTAQRNTKLTQELKEAKS